MEGNRKNLKSRSRKRRKKPVLPTLKNQYNKNGIRILSDREPKKYNEDGERI